MNKTFVAVALGVCMLSGTVSAVARGHHDYVDQARVISATPLYEAVRINRPVEECWTETVVREERYRKSYTGTLAGGILGGVIGNQFGRGSGKTAMTVAGTLLGASIGNDLSGDRYPRRYVTDERRCEVYDRYETREQLVGYRVKYRYQGQTFVTETSEHPGRYIPVRVDVEPIARY
jgi:uncharacterized protein YcfJ